MILVDDGSPDNCPAMCDYWAQKDSRIRVIHKKNGGQGSARNAGIDAARGEYLGFVDSDDYIAPEMYEVLLKLLMNNDADMSICSYQGVTEDGIPLQNQSDALEDKILIGDEVLTEWMTKNWRYMLVVTKLCKSELFCGLRFPEVKLHEDEYMAHRILSKCRKSVSTSARMYMYAHRDNSTMGNVLSSFNPQRIDDLMFAYKDRYNVFVEVGRKDLADIAAWGCYHFILLELRRGSYLKNFRLFNKAIGFTVKVSLKSSGLKPKLRPIKIALWILRNIAKDYYHFLRR